MLNNSKILSGSDPNISRDHIKPKKLKSTKEMQFTGSTEEMTNQHRFIDAESITDLHCDENRSEVHLISLLEERIPRYTLRADIMTKFTGYENEDWTIRSTCLPSDFDPQLSTDLMEQTLKYFILGGCRVSQVTKTYNDTRALTLLLEEKERDLEIASEIGKILVQRVKSLEETVERLTKQQKDDSRKISDLQRELTLRESLLRAYVKDFDSDSEIEDDQKGVSDQTSLQVSSVNLENLGRKVRGLQAENDRMASAMVKIEGELEEEQDHEFNLVADCYQHLIQTNVFIQFLREELDVKTELVNKQNEEINMYAEKLLTLEGHNRQLNEDLKIALQRISEAENQHKSIAAEVEYSKERYAECLQLLQASQEENKTLRKSQQLSTTVIHRNYSSSSFFMSQLHPFGSLASEIHDSQKKDLFFHMGYSPSAINLHSRKVMDVAKTVSRLSSQKCIDASQSQIRKNEVEEETNLVDSDRDSLQSQCGSSGHSSYDLSDSEVTEDSDMTDWNQHQRLMADSGRLYLGQPGVPGSNDLEYALRRIRAPAKASPSPSNGETTAGVNRATPELDQRQSRNSPNFQDSQFVMEFPRSQSSASLSSASDLTFTPTKPKIPEKLQIVKPLEGSVTLNQWKALTVANLAGFLEFRPGIQTKGQPLERFFEDEIYSMSDFEEDSIPVTEEPSSPVFSPSQTSDYNSMYSRFDSSSRDAKQFKRNKLRTLDCKCVDERNTIPTTENDQGPRTLPDVVTSGRSSFSLTPLPIESVPSCILM